MKKISLSLLLIPFLAVMMSGKPARAQTTINFSQVQIRVAKSFNLVAIIPGQWTRGDWDNPQVTKEFVRKLGQVSDRLAGLENLLDQFNEDPQPSTEGKIRAWLAVASGQIQGLESMTQKHLVTPAALEG